jgi:hypothetical protein
VRGLDIEVISVLDRDHLLELLPVAEVDMGPPLGTGGARGIAHRIGREDGAGERYAGHRVDGQAGRGGDPIGQERAVLQHLDLNGPRAAHASTPVSGLACHPWHRR